MRPTALLLVAALAVLAVPAPANQLEPGADPWYALHAFEGQDGCLAVREGQRLKPGDRVLVFARDRPARVVRIAYLVDGDSAKRIFDERGFKGVYPDKELWGRIGCYWGLGVLGDPPPLAIARYDAADTLDGEHALAIAGLPESAVTMGADGAPIAPRELESLAMRMSAVLPKPFSHGTLLRAGRRYRSNQGHELIELFLGKPAMNRRGVGAPIDSIEILRLFARDGRVLASQRIVRASGHEEHVDVEPPQLDERNWFLDPDRTLGFVSRDGGATWDRLGIDVGFEGIAWSIRRLAPGMPALWDFSLYTRH